MPQSKPLKRGRPRSELSRKKILNATNRLLLTQSVQELSIESIAKKAKVGKTTIYRWWPHKIAVVLEAVAGDNDNSADVMARSTDPQEQIRAFLANFIHILRDKNGRVVIEAMAEAQASHDTLTIFYEHFMLDHEKTLADIIDGGKAKGVFRDSLDTAMAVDMILGSIVYQLMSGAETLDPDFAKNVQSETVRLLKP